MKIVWVALYCDCIYESSFGIISIHQTPQGAYKAMKQHMLKEYDWWIIQRSFCGRKLSGKFGIHQAWKVKKYLVDD